MVTFEMTITYDFKSEPYGFAHRLNVYSDERAKARNVGRGIFLRWLVYLTDLVVDNLLKCFTFPPSQPDSLFRNEIP